MDPAGEPSRMESITSLAQAIVLLSVVALVYVIAKAMQEFTDDRDDDD